MCPPPSPTHPQLHDDCNATHNQTHSQTSTVPPLSGTPSNGLASALSLSCRLPNWLGNFVVPLVTATLSPDAWFRFSPAVLRGRVHRYPILKPSRLAVPNKLEYQVQSLPQIVYPEIFTHTKKKKIGELEFSFKYFLENGVTFETIKP